MTPKAAVKQSEMRRMAAIAKEFGITVECEVEGRIFRFAPTQDQTPRSHEPVWGGTTWAEWKNRHNKSAPSEGHGVRSSRIDPLARWYRQIGYDPITMDQSDLSRLMAKAEEDWKSEIPSLPLNKLERRALEHLAAYGPNREINWREVKNCGPATEERLEARGFLKVIKNKQFPDRAGSIILTDAGYEAAQALGFVEEIRL